MVFVSQAQQALADDMSSILDHPPLQFSSILTAISPAIDGAMSRGRGINSRTPTARCILTAVLVVSLATFHHGRI